MKPDIQHLHAGQLGDDLRARIFALCSDAYEEDFTPHLALLADATHVLATMDGELVAHAAWVRRELRVGTARRPLSCAYVEAVATTVRLQRRGLGTAVLRAIPALVSDFDIAALSPSEPAFYARSGWALWQGPLFHLQDGQRHRSDDEQVMVLRLPRTPAWLDLRDDLETDWREGDVW
jgi:GNAT superfamily N-acetyltransferase